MLSAVKHFDGRMRVEEIEVAVVLATVGTGHLSYDVCCKEDCYISTDPGQEQVTEFLCYCYIGSVTCIQLLFHVLSLKIPMRLMCD